jgi:precorrin-3B C17-methyltransferase
MSGRLAVVGLGPGDDRYLTREAYHALETADALYGYGPYLERVPARQRQTRHASDNREEGARAEAALRHAADGASVAIVSGGDPGVFAMAASVCEAIETGPETWRALDIAVIPGITAMLAVAARAGAPLGHDFCLISLSDLLTPWGVIESRVRAAAKADFAVCFYNPRSKRRRDPLDRAMAILREHRPPQTPVVVAAHLGREKEHVTVTTLDAFDAEAVDMTTLVIVGASTTRAFRRGDADAVYTPRGYAKKREGAA